MILSLLAAFAPLMFTAPGDTIPPAPFSLSGAPTVARVARYEARMASGPTAFLQMWNGTAPITKMYAIADSSAPQFVPHAPGTTERFYVAIERDGLWHRVSVTSYDAAGNKSPASNVGSVLRQPIPPLAQVSGVLAAIAGAAAGAVALFRRRRKPA